MEELIDTLKDDTPDPAYLSTVPGQYERIASILEQKYKQRRVGDTWSAPACMTLRNWMVSLIKAGNYVEAEQKIRHHMRECVKDHAGFSPLYWILQCLLTSSLILQDRIPEAEVRFINLIERPAHRRFSPVMEEFEELKWIYCQRQDHHVLHESWDGLKGLVFKVAKYSSVPSLTGRVAYTPTARGGQPIHSSQTRSWRERLRRTRQDPYTVPLHVQGMSTKALQVPFRADRRERAEGDFALLNSSSKLDLTCQSMSTESLRVDGDVRLGDCIVAGDLHAHAMALDPSPYSVTNHYN